jgi:hypothetical protein
MVNPLEHSGNDDTVFSTYLKDVGYISRWRKIMQMVLLLWHSKWSYSFYGQDKTSGKLFMLGTGLVCILG